MENSSTKELFKSLEELYESKEYESVISMLLENKDKISKGDFHYNLGTAYLKNNNLSASRYHFEKAYHEGHMTPQLLRNLETSKSFLNVKELERSDYFKDNLLSLSKSFPFESYLLISLIILVISVLLFRLKKIKMIPLGVLLGLAIVFSSFGLYVEKSIQQAIVLESSTVLEGPSRSFDETAELPRGIKVIIKKRDDKWVFVESPLHYSGWIERVKLGIL